MVVVGRKLYRAGRRVGKSSGRDRKARGGIVTRLDDGWGTPPGPKPWSTAGGALPDAVAERRRVQVEMWSEKGVIVWGARDAGEVGTGAVGPVDSTGSVPCTELPKGVG